MTWIDLGNPSPLDIPIPYHPLEWPAAEVIKLPVPNDLKKCDFFEVLEGRRSRRVFEKISMNQIADLLWYCCRIQRNKHADLGFPLSLRSYPSAGSIHPIHVLINWPRKEGWLRYDPLEHALIVIPNSQDNAAATRVAVDSVVASKNGVIFMFLAEPGKTFSKYVDANSLVWRDAGVLLGYLSLIAQALKLSFCPLGITGEPWARQLDKQGRLVGVGMSVVGTCAPSL